MSNLTLHRDPPSAPPVTLIKPEPRTPISIRPANEGDLKFIDALMKKHNKMVGFSPTGQLVKNIEAGNVLIAEEGNGQWAMGNGGSPSNCQLPVANCPTPTPVGYCIHKDKYLKRDEVGIFYQLNVVPGKQRGLIGASLVKAAFERSAYGCRLYCCWCAQDIEANHFWESLGFVPLAFRTGSRPRMRKDGTVSKRERIHIFWQRRIREGDVSTPYWFPSETSGGAIKENRIVLPIMPGMHWTDAKPAVLPGEGALGNGQSAMGDVPKALPGERKRGVKPAPVISRPPSRGVWKAPPQPPAPTKEQLAAAKKAEKAEQKARRPKFKNDPKYIAAARELRDKFVEQLDAGLILPPSAQGKYEVGRQLKEAVRPAPVALLQAA